MALYFDFCRQTNRLDYRVEKKFKEIFLFSFSKASLIPDNRNITIVVDVRLLISVSNC